MVQIVLFGLLFVSGLLTLLVFNHYSIVPQALQQEHYTPEKYWLDLSAGFTSLFACAALVSALLPLKHLKDLKGLTTLSNKAAFYILLNLAWVLTVPSSVLFYGYRQHRFDYPVNADSIAIPLFEWLVFAVLLLPLFNLLVFAGLRNTRLPYPLLARFPSWNSFSVGIEIFYILLLSFSTIVLYGQIEAGDITGIPLSLIIIYLFLSLRACHVGKQHAKFYLENNPQDVNSY